MQSFEGESESIPVSALRQFSFCPRTVFFSEVRDLRPVCGEWVENGIDFHAREEMLIRRRNLEGLGIPLGSELRTELRLRSVLLGLHGICDAAYFFTDEEGRQRAVPLEFKSSERLRWRRAPSCRPRRTRCSSPSSTAASRTVASSSTGAGGRLSR